MPKVTQPWNPNTGIGIQAVRLQGFCSPSTLHLRQFPLSSTRPTWPDFGAQGEFQKFQFRLDPLGQLKECPGSQFFYIKMGSVPHLQGCDG